MVVDTLHDALAGYLAVSIYLISGLLDLQWLHYVWSGR